MNDLPPLARMPILILGMMSLLGGVLAGLARLACAVPAVASDAAGLHGALMISVFFGTVISPERAVAIGRRWAYLAPAAAGASGIVMLAGWPLIVAMTLSVIAATIMLAASIQVLRRQTAPFTIVLAIGSVCWLIGSLAWLTADWIAPAVPWWLSFRFITSDGERLELSRFLPTPALARRAFYGIVGCLLFCNMLSLWQPASGLVIVSAGLLALPLWLMRFDIACRNAHLSGLPQFVAICLLSGYFWLVFAGLLGIGGGFVPGHVGRDSSLHAVGLGFVFAMVFGHAPIIFPAITRLKIPFHPVFYLPLLLLHASLLLRVGANLLDDFDGRKLGGMANALTLALFIAMLLGSMRQGRNATARKTSKKKEVDHGLRC